MSQRPKGSLYERKRRRRKERKKKKREYPFNISKREVGEIGRAVRLILKSVGYEITGRGLRTGMARDLYYEVGLKGKIKSNQDQIAFGLKSISPRLIFEIIYNHPDKMIPEIYSLLKDTIKKYELDLSVYKM